MSADLGIRAAVRAAVERESDHWMTGLAGWNDGILRGSAYGAVLFATEHDAAWHDYHDASAMRWWSQAPHYAPRRFLREVTP